MKDPLTLEGFSLRPQGPTLSMSLSAGRTMALVGPPASGKSRLIRALAGRERPGQGHIAADGAALAEPVPMNRRLTPQSIARRAAGSGGSQEAAAALAATGLWEVRATPITSLTATQLKLTELLIPLASPGPLMLVDGQFDAIDAWSWPELWEGFLRRIRAGSALVAVCNRTDVLTSFDWLLGLFDHQVRFAGSPEDLRREGGESEIEVITQNQRGVRALVEPFHVRIRESEDGLILQAAEGQALAAKLLLEGYGDVSQVVVRRTTLDEALRRRVR